MRRQSSAAGAVVHRCARGSRRQGVRAVRRECGLRAGGSAFASAACDDGGGGDGADTLVFTPLAAAPLCTDCHKVDKPIFVKQHLDYPVGKSDCTSCHDPHGTQPRIVRDALIQAIERDGATNIFAKGGKTNEQMRQLGRNLAKVANQKKSVRKVPKSGI